MGDEKPAKKEEVEPKAWKVGLVILVLALGMFFYALHYYVSPQESAFSREVASNPEEYEGQEVELVAELQSISSSEYFDYYLFPHGRNPPPSKLYYLNYDGRDVSCDGCRIIGTVEKIEMCDCYTEDERYPSVSVDVCADEIGGTCSNIREVYYINASYVKVVLR